MPKFAAAERERKAQGWTHGLNQSHHPAKNFHTSNIRTRQRMSSLDRLNAHKIPKNILDSHVLTMPRAQDGWTALHSAVANGHIENARALYKHGRTPLNPNIKCHVKILPCSPPPWALVPPPLSVTLWCPLCLTTPHCGRALAGRRCTTQWSSADSKSVACRGVGACSRS